MDLLPIVQNFGLPVALTVFFVWSGYLRERRMAERLDTVEDAIREHLKDVVAENTATQKQVLITLARLETDCAARMAAHSAEGRA